MEQECHPWDKESCPVQGPKYLHDEEELIGPWYDIVRVIPLRGDTLLVVESNRIVRVLRDGSYIDEEIVPFKVGSHSFHGGLHWIAPNSARAFYLWAVSPSGKIARRYELPPSPNAEDGWHSGEVVSWGDDLWVWEYPRGPLLRVSPSSGRIIDRGSHLNERDTKNGGSTASLKARAAPS